MPRQPSAAAPAVASARISDTAETADFSTRFTAWMIDACVLFSGQWIVAMVMSRQLQAAGMTASEPCVPDSPFLCEGPSTALWALIFVFIVVSTIGYHAWFDGVVGASPGKRMMGLRVVDTGSGSPSAPDQRIGIARGTLRAVVRQAAWIWAFLFIGASPISVDLPAVLWFALFGFSLLPLVWAATSPSGLGPHDSVADTAVRLANPAAPRRAQAATRSRPTTT